MIDFKYHSEDEFRFKILIYSKKYRNSHFGTSGSNFKTLFFKPSLEKAKRKHTTTLSTISMDGFGQPRSKFLNQYSIKGNSKNCSFYIEISNPAALLKLVWKKFTFALISGTFKLVQQLKNHKYYLYDNRNPCTRDHRPLYITQNSGIRAVIQGFYPLNTQLSSRYHELWQWDISMQEHDKVYFCTPLRNARKIRILCNERQAIN